MYSPQTYVGESTGPSIATSKCSSKQESLFDIDSCSIIVDEISLDHDDKQDKSILEGHTLACLHTDSFCTPLLKHPNIIVWFPADV